MLCCMIFTKSESTNQTYVTLTHFIHHGVADALLRDLDKIRHQSTKHTSSSPISSIMVSPMFCCMIKIRNKPIKPTTSLPISSIMASQMLCCMIYTIRNQSIIPTHFIHHSAADALLMISTKSEINQSNLANPCLFHPLWHRRCFAAWSRQNQKSINSI